MSELVIKPEQLDEVIENLLDKYGDAVYYSLHDAADETASKAVKEVKARAPVRTGDYKKSIAVQKDNRRELGEVRSAIYVKSPKYRIAHLLENGHAIAGGTGRVRAFKHFEAGEKYVTENFEKILIDKIERR